MKILLPLAAILMASPVWAAQNSNVKISTSALSFNGSSGSVSSQPITITAGSRPVTITSVSFSNNTFFGPRPTLPITLSSGQSLTGQVSANPKSTAQTGKLTIVSNAGTLTVSLYETATAAKPAAHSVSLSWDAPNGATAVDSYQVERAPSGSGQYSVVGTTTAASTTYSDTSVQAGQTYLYEVRAVNSQGDASGPSNTISLTIP